MERSQALEGWRRQTAKWSLHLHVGAPSVPALCGSCSVLITGVCFPRLLNVLCCSLDSFLLLESQYSVSSMLLHSQGENVVDGDGYGPQAQLDTVLHLKRSKGRLRNWEGLVELLVSWGDSCADLGSVRLSWTQLAFLLTGHFKASKSC